MKFDILGGSYENQAKEANSSQTINWYPKISQQEEDATQISLYLSPGLTSWLELGSQNLRGGYVTENYAGQRAFVVGDNVLYEIYADGNSTARATLTDITVGTKSPVYIQANLSNQLFIADNQAGYVYNLSTNTATKISDGDYPSSVSSADYVDQYGVIVSGGSVYLSNVGNFSSWTGTDLYTPSYKAYPTKAIVVNKEQIYNFTTQTIEIFINDGQSPYSRLPRSTLLVGIVAKDTAIATKDGCFFLGREAQGSPKVYFLDLGGNVVPISDHNINWQLNRAQTLANATAFIQVTKFGHLWYYLNCPELPYTFIYDFNTKYWHWRQSKAPYTESTGESITSRFRGHRYMYFDNKHLFLDMYTGTVFLEDFDNKTENGIAIHRRRRSQHFRTDDNNNIEINQGIIECTTGHSNNDYLTLSYSRDGGNTFSTPRPVSLGAMTKFNSRVRLSKLGTARRWVFNLEYSGTGDLVIQQAWFNGLRGSN